MQRVNELSLNEYAQDVGLEKLREAINKYVNLKKVNKKQPYQFFQKSRKKPLRIYPQLSNIVCFINFHLYPSRILSTFVVKIMSFYFPHY